MNIRLREFAIENNDQTRFAIQVKFTWYSRWYYLIEISGEHYVKRKFSKDYLLNFYEATQITRRFFEKSKCPKGN